MNNDSEIVLLALVQIRESGWRRMPNVAALEVIVGF